MVAKRKHDDRYEEMNPQDDNAYEQGEEEMRGIPMAEEAFELVLSVESPYHYEWIDGMIYNMAPQARHIALLLRTLTECFLIKLAMMARAACFEI